MSVLYLILGIALIVLGALLAIVVPVAGIVAVVFGVILIVLSRKAKKPKAESVQQTQQPIRQEAAQVQKPVSPAPAAQKKPKIEPENHYLTDINESLILRSAELNDDYKCSKRELVDLGYSDESIYKYDTITAPVIIQESADGLDVMFRDEVIGKIKSGSVSRVRNALADPRLDHADLVIYGGPHKYISEDEDDNGRTVYEITSYSDAPFKAAIKVYIKQF